MKPRDQIEAELHAALESARQEYEKHKSAAWGQLDSAHAAMGTSDGILALRQADQDLKNYHRALEEYYKALCAFNDFVLHGKLPPDPDHK